MAQSPRARERHPARVKAFRCWAVVTYDGHILTVLDGGLAIYATRTDARVSAGEHSSKRMGELRVVPLTIRSAQHRPR